MALPQTTIPIRRAIAAITPYDELERTHITDALAWIDTGTNIFRLAPPDKPPKHLVAYFVVIDPQHQSMLLCDHIKAQLWLPSGGHVERGELPQDTVRREACEELQLEASFLKNHDKPFFVTVTQTVGLTAGHTDVSLWYVLRGDIHQTIRFDRREFNDVTWFTCQEILDSHPAIFDPHMRRFTKKLLQSGLLAG